MVTFKHILIPTDFSESANKAIDYALPIAKQFQSRLSLIHVYEPIIYYADAPIGMPDVVEIEQNIRTSAEDSLRLIVDQHIKPREAEYGPIAVERILVQGKPYLEILRAAFERRVDLIVLSTHGRSGLEHILMGSVTEKVVRKAPCPVLTVRVKGEFKIPDA
jgi:nucleotide-binding universal stress UspA family protein